MVEIQDIRLLVEDWVKDRNIYIVDIIISKSNKILIIIDKKEGLSIEECVELSRNIEKKLDRDNEDFELEVTSPGLDQPFKVIQQYHKNIGKEVDVTLKNGLKIKGVLKEVSHEEIEIEENKRIKVEGKKKKQQTTVNHRLKMNDIKATRVVVTFK